jgi:energy-coupling factor transporter ATP-binding protein EcfA2
MRKIFGQFQNGNQRSTLGGAPRIDSPRFSGSVYRCSCNPSNVSIEGTEAAMKIRGINAANVQPIHHFEVDDLSDVIVLAGPNGVGKTRLVGAMLSAFQSPVANATVKFKIEATSKIEAESWGKPLLDTSNQQDAQKLAATLQKAKKRSNWQSTVINFESDRSIQQIAPFAFSWDYQDPFEEPITWNFGWGGLRNRFQDTLHSIFRKVRSRRELIARRAEELFAANRSAEPILLSPMDFPDPMDQFKHAFSQLLAPKVLLDAEPKVQQLEYGLNGQRFPISSLSSGEREVVNIVFDFILRSPSDSIVVFDEPELHLHPELSYKLLQTLKSAGTNNQFVLCTHSPDIITASLDSSVVFISPPKNNSDNQAIRVTEDDSTHRALKLLGQSIGIISLGKKIVLIEGTNSSLDKQVYGSILRDRFPNLVLVPGGGKGILKSFDTVQREVLEKTIWGVEFFMLCDRDAVPLFKSSEEMKKLTGERVEVLRRYHLENYFLDENVLAGVFSHMEPEGSPLRSPASIRATLLEIARTHASYAVALTVALHLREMVGNIDVMPKECNGKSPEELVAMFISRSGLESARVSGELDPGQIEKMIRERFQGLVDSLERDTDDWKFLIPGKPVFNTFAGKSKMDAPRLKTLFIREAYAQNSGTFDDIFSIFQKFAS